MRRAPRSLRVAAGMVLVLLGVGCRSESTPVAVPALTWQTGPRGERQPVIDGEAYRIASAALDLPPPPVPADLETAAFEKLHRATESVAESRDAAAYARVGAIYYAYSLRENAIRCYEQAHARDPDDARWVHLLARLLGDEGELDRAIECVAEARRLDPALAASAGLAGGLFLAAGQHSEALEAFAAYAALRPEDAYGHYGQAQTLMRLDRYEEAGDHLTRARVRAPGSPQVSYLEGRLLAKLGRAQEATRRVAPMAAATAHTGLTYHDPLFLAVHEETESSFRLRLDYQVESSRGNLEAAARSAEALLQRRPEDVGTMYNLAGIYRQLKAYDRARAWLEKALALEPRFARLHTGLAEIHLEKNELPEAEVKVRDALAIDAGFGRALGLRGLLAMRRRQWAKAEASLLAAMQAEPRQAQYVFYLASVYEQQGKRAQAIVQYRRVLSLAPDHRGARARLRALGQRTD